MLPLGRGDCAGATFDVFDINDGGGACEARLGPPYWICGLEPEMKPPPTTDERRRFDAATAAANAGGTCEAEPPRMPLPLVFPWSISNDYFKPNFEQFIAFFALSFSAFIGPKKSAKKAQKERQQKESSIGAQIIQ